MYNKVIRSKLKEKLLKLDNRQFKLFYGMLVHYWVKKKYFISNQNFLNLWCELNELCSEVDEGFPDPYDDRELMKSYCQEHPFYFIDILDSEPVINLFCQHFNHSVDLLIGLAQRLDTRGLRAAYEFIIKEFEMVDNDIDKLIN